MIYSQWNKLRLSTYNLMRELLNAEIQLAQTEFLSCSLGWQYLSTEWPPFLSCIVQLTITFSIVRE